MVALILLFENPAGAIEILSRFCAFIVKEQMLKNIIKHQKQNRALIIYNFE
jgi:hypothetical protein